MVSLVLIFLGLCLGSFINALTWRLHEQSKPKAKSHLSILKGRSLCPDCRHQLEAKDLVPVVSWLWLRGKCRYCRKPIAVQYPLVELLTATAFVLSYIWWPVTPWDGQQTTLFSLWLVFLVGLIALAVYDLKWYLLPDKIVFSLMGVSAVQSLLLVFIFDGGVAMAGQIALSFMVGGGLFYVLFQISSGKWIGGGDVKLGMALGLILADPSLSLLMIFGASLLGSAVTLPLLAMHKINKSSRVPFGPFLIAAAIIARLFGTAMIEWYQGMLII